VSLIAATLLLASCGSASKARTAEPAPDTRHAPFDIDGHPVRTTAVRLEKSYSFTPPVIAVRAGDTVTWTNADAFLHTVRMRDGSGIDKPIAVGDAVAITFDTPGSYLYDCTLHPTQMRGKVVVREQQP
jgi:plastocyanin